MLGLIRSLHSVTDTFSPLDRLKRVEEVLGAGSYQVTPLCHRHILSPSSSQKVRGGARCWVLSGHSTLSPTHSLPFIVSKGSRRCSVLGPIRSLHSITDTFSPLDRLKRVEEVLGHQRRERAEITVSSGLVFENYYFNKPINHPKTINGFCTATITITITITSYII